MTTTAYPETTSAAPATATARSLSIVGFALGLGSVVLGQTFLVPIAAIVLGVMGYRREPAGRGFAVAAIVLGSVMAFGWMIAAVVGIAMTGPLVLLSLL